MHIIVWVAVICDDCLINYISRMLVCFCFSRFFCFFLWAFGVTNFPLLKLLVSRHRTRRVSKKCIYLETQLNRMELSADCSEIGNSSSEYKRNPGWNVSIKFALTCTPHSRNDQTRKKIRLCARLTEYYQRYGSETSLIFRWAWFWNPMYLEASKNMAYTQRGEKSGKTPFHARNQ